MSLLVKILCGKMFNRVLLIKITSWLRLNRLNLALSCLIFISIAILYSLSIYLNLDNENISNRIRIHALPVVISSMYHGHIWDYTAYQTVADWFSNNVQPIDALIADAIQLRVPDNDSIYYWAVDDRGLADYIRISFTLFGPQINSLFKFCFVVLSVSNFFYVIGYFTNPTLLGFGIFINSAIIASIPTFNLIHVELTNFNFIFNSEDISFLFSPGINLYESRIFDIFSYLSIFHIAALSIISPPSKKENWIRIIVAAIGQLTIFMFLCHCRSSLKWQLLPVIAFIVSILVYRLIRRNIVFKKEKQFIRKSGKQVVHIILPGLLLIIGLISLSTYQHQTFNERYYADRGSRTFWHNMLMGLSETELGKSYGLKVNDNEAVAFVLKYLKENNDSRGYWTENDVLASFGGEPGHTTFDLPMYEQAARDAYFHFWHKKPLALFTEYSINKPVNHLKALYNYSVLSMVNSSHPLRKKSYQLGINYNPFNYRSLLLVLPTIILLSRSIYLSSFVKLLPLTFFLLIFSLIPSVVFY
ncbi:hypothetical protein, partial [Crocosphaera watsonii]|uniref:hypothetical protein n=1 Tax=Crocosphaera watsonii TaxID=263511 RepID=UPI0012E3131E